MGYKNSKDGETDSLTDLIKCIVIYRSWSISFWALDNYSKLLSFRHEKVIIITVKEYFCFYYYQTYSESCEMATVNYLNCQNFKIDRCQKSTLLCFILRRFEVCWYFIWSSNVHSFAGNVVIVRQTHIQNEYIVTLHSTNVGEHPFIIHIITLEMHGTTIESMKIVKPDHGKWTKFSTKNNLKMFPTKHKRCLSLQNDIHSFKTQIKLVCKVL